MHSAVNTSLPTWELVHRLIPSHFPPINLFEDVSEPDDLEIVFAIEALTNDRIKDEVGELALVPANERISGAGSTPIMAAFTHISDLYPTRFSDNTRYGVYYGANNLDTAFAETIFHREKFLSATKEPDTDLTMRNYTNQVALELHDVTGKQYTDLYTEDYAKPQAFAKEMRNQGSNGLLYNSVRDIGGLCVAAFKPKTMTIPAQGGHYTYKWCGSKQKIINIIKLELIR
jgi:hypothetical protein